LEVKTTHGVATKYLQARSIKKIATASMHAENILSCMFTYEQVPVAPLVLYNIFLPLLPFWLMAVVDSLVMHGAQ
jgi:hypothetical protein